MAQIFYRSGTTVLDRLGNLAPGARIYFHPAATLDQLVVYRTSALTVGSEWTQPVVCDGYGMIPAVYLDDTPGGNYRYRITTAAGMIITDLLTVPYPTIGGGGGGAPDPSTVAATGWTMWQPLFRVLDGWIRLNGRSIGDFGSTATERAQADCEALFTLLWNGLLDAQAPVLPSRGASAAADWGAKRIIFPPDMRGRAAFGLDQMGSGAPAGRLTSASMPGSTIVGTSGGVDVVTLSAAQIPAHSHAVGTLALAPNGAHSHGPSLGGTTAFVIAPTTTLPGDAVRSDGGVPHTVLGKQTDYLSAALTDTEAAHTHTISGATANSAGGGQLHTNLPPALVGTYYMKLSLPFVIGSAMLLHIIAGGGLA